MLSNNEVSLGKPNMIVMLDAIVDIPTAIISRDYPDIGESILNNVNYRNRESDELHLIDPRINALRYSSAYANRGSSDDLLNYAKSTLMIPYIHKLLSKLQHEIDGNNPVIKHINLILNVYPYQLDEDRCKLISLGLSTALGLSQVCEVVNIPTSEMNKKFLTDNGICHLILYDFNDWATSALPDQKASDLTELGLDRIENFTVTAAKLALVSADVNEAKALFDEHGLADAYDEWVLLPWNLIFELDLLPVVFYTQLDEQLKEKIMSDSAESNKSIDVEVSLVSEFQHLLSLAITSKDWLDRIPARLVEISNKLASINCNPNPDYINELRLLLAESRFLIDVMSSIIPTQPAIDFERYVDSEMSKFDICMENSQISENYWNSKNVKCKRIIRDIKSLGRSAYILLAHEDAVDSDGVIYRKGEVLPSAMYFDPILEKVTQTEIDVFIADLKGE